MSPSYMTLILNNPWLYVPLLGFLLLAGLCVAEMLHRIWKRQ
jgi:hypothetical protein